MTTRVRPRRVIGGATLVAIGGVEAEQVVGDALRVGRGPEHLLAVGFQRLQPGRQVGGGVVEIAGVGIQLGADEMLSNLNANLLSRVVMRAEAVAQVAVEPGVRS